MIIEINLNSDLVLAEGWLDMFAGSVKAIMKSLLGGPEIPVRVKGNRQAIKAFGELLGKEKKYIYAVAKYGLNDPRTYKNKFSLYKAISRFERVTGLKWPFKG